MDGPIHEGCITNEELAGWLKLVEEGHARRGGRIRRLRRCYPNARTPPSTSRITLAIIATLAAAVTLAWLAFLVWLAFKGISLL